MIRLADLMAISRERELTDAEQVKVLQLTQKQRAWHRRKAELNAARRGARSKSDVARQRPRDQAGRFIG